MGPKIGQMAGSGEREQSAPSQRLEALKHANAVRSERAELKRALRSGTVDIAELLLGPPEFLLSARLSQILLTAPGYGQVRVNRLLKRCRISPLRTIGGLSERQREELARALVGTRRGP
ncbi:MAG: hypothetical protein JWO14_2934 [Solirubrobacterales bacterium]|nr:hypothetical protein [Solirubrobacterales bacterium]